MKKRKTLIEKGKSNIKIKPIFSEKEVKERDIDYLKISNKNFDEQYRLYAFKPVSIFIDNKEYGVQYNFCIDTFCPNYGENIKLLKKRGTRSVRNYTFMGSKRAKPFIQCNITEHVDSKSRVPNNNSILVSNWSVAEEIRRLKRISSVKDKEYDYTFHRESCSSTTTPFDENNDFYKNGTTKSGSQKYICKVCGKSTNINEDVTKNFSYNQQRNDVLINLIEDIIYRIPIRKICKRNRIGAGTFYDKVEWIYRKCLEFLSRHEQLETLEFYKLYLVSDVFKYSLNNVRKKGYGGKKKNEYEEKTALDSMTDLVAIGDAISHYIFSADLAYDFDLSLNDISKDTKKYHTDHSYVYLNQYAKVRNLAFEPQPPTKKDTQSIDDYKDALGYFNAREKYVDGIHINYSYTLLARLFLLQNQLNYQKLIFISDDDNGIKSSVFRAFKDDFKNYDALYFTSQYDKTLDKKKAFTESVKTRNELKRWSSMNGFDVNRLYECGIENLKRQLDYHNFYTNKKIKGKILKKASNNLIEHPLPYVDEGRRLINLISYNPYITNDELAHTIIDVKMRTIDNFFHELRRDINILERPLVGARGDGKTYIYSNYNPRYAHQMITIFRTLYNFVWERKYYDGKKMTPAQRIGLVEKKYSYRDIIYFR